MIFESLLESSIKGELLFCEGGMLRYHRRKDNQITIHELLVLPSERRMGKGTSLLNRLLEKEKEIVCIVAKCPEDLKSGNNWYRKIGFVLIDFEYTKSGRKLNIWKLQIKT